MSIKEQVDKDLKVAMLAGDKTLVTTLRGLKSAILDVEIAKNLRDTGLGDQEVVGLFQKEAKKRQESADMYVQGKSQERADAELTEKIVIEKYLPEQMSEQELISVIDSVIVQTGASGMQAMGQVMGAVKQQVGAKADGSVMAKLVKDKLQ